MMIGLPGVGKSTFVEEYVKNGYRVASSDTYVDMVAGRLGKTYDQTWSQMIAKEAQTYCDANAQLGFDDKANVVWDQTNLTVKSRRNKLLRVPPYYHKSAVVVQCLDPLDHDERLNRRPGKSIPYSVILSMSKTMQHPTYDEGFDSIMFIYT